MCRTRTKTPQTTYNCDSKAANQAVGRQETQPIRRSPATTFLKTSAGSLCQTSAWELRRGIQNASEIKNGTTPGMKIDPCIGIYMYKMYIILYIIIYVYIITIYIYTTIYYTYYDCIGIYSS